MQIMNYFIVIYSETFFSDEIEFSNGMFKFKNMLEKKVEMIEFRKKEREKQISRIMQSNNNGVFLNGFYYM